MSLREYIVAKKHHAFRCDHPCLTDLAQEYARLGLSPKERMTRRFELLASLEQPVLLPEFVCALADALGSVHKAIQTSGFASPEIYRNVIGHFDYVMQDIKLADNEAHIRYTGVGNAQILENTRWLQESGKAFVFRVPLIPGITDTEENLQAISRIVGSCRTELLPYNPLAGAKYPMVGMEYSLSGEENRP